jgi:hypothetical protein
MRKITTVFCMLLVSAILLAASSYAWFSMNNQVTATGLDVTVTVPSSLSISVTNESEGFIADVVLVNESSMGATIMPSVYGTTANTSKELDFFVLTPAAMATVNENGILGEIPDSDASKEVITENDYYIPTETDYFKDVMWLRYDGTESETVDLNVKIEWDNTDVDDVIKNAFHIVFIDKDGTVLIDYDMSEADSTKALGLTLTSGAGTGTKVTAYGYLAGSDPQCKNSAISSNTTLKVKITFFGA